MLLPMKRTPRPRCGVRVAKYLSRFILVTGKRDTHRLVSSRLDCPVPFDELEIPVSIERNKKRLIGLGAAIAVIVGWTTWIAAVPGPGTGHSFTMLQSPFTQDLYATTGTGGIPSGGILGGVAFTPAGRVWSAECTFLGTRLHRFASATTLLPVHESAFVHPEEAIVDLTNYAWSSGGMNYFGAGGCGLVNHSDGSMYSSSTAGIWQLNATTGDVMAGPFGPGSNALGIAVDPQADSQGRHHLVYVGGDCHPSLSSGNTCTLWDVDPVAHTSMVFARLARDVDTLIDGIYFDPTGEFIFAAHRQEFIDNEGVITKHNSLQIIRRPVALKPANTPIDDTQACTWWGWYRSRTGWRFTRWTASS